MQNIILNPFEFTTAINIFLSLVCHPLVDKVSKIAPDSDEDNQPQIELVNKKNQNRDGTISKPRAKRGSLPEMQPHNRTPSLDKDKIQKGLQVGRKLSQSPSVVNIQGHPINSDDGGEDDQQPMKPVINYDGGQD